MPVPGSTKGPSPVLGLGQDPSRQRVLEGISFDFHYKATTVSLVAPVLPMEMVSHGSVSETELTQACSPPGKGSGEGGRPCDHVKLSIQAVK